MSGKIHDIITEKIIEKLEQGVVPWRKPWVSGGAVNWKTQKPYRGINIFLLDAGEYSRGWRKGKKRREISYNSVLEVAGKRR